MLKLLTMSMDIFNKVLGNVDESYPFLMSPKLILALLVLTGICTIVMGILFLWYKRKTSFMTSTMGNILKLIPSLKEKIPTLDSLLHILEQAPPQNAKNALTTVSVPWQLQPPPDELILPPVLVPKLHMNKPPTNTTVPYHATHMEPLPSTSSATDYKSEPLSLEMFNCTATDLNEKGAINIKKYKIYLYKPPH